MAAVLAKLYRGIKKSKSKSLVSQVPTKTELVCVDGLIWKSVPIEFSRETHLEDFKKYLLDSVRPEWDERALTSKSFDVGTTNALFAIYDKNKGLDADTVLIRINGNGTENLISRRDEIVSLVYLHRHHLSPPVHAQLSNGMCYGFMAGKSLVTEDLTNPFMMKRIVRALVKMHSLEIPTSFRDREPQVWYKSAQWLKLVPTHFDEADKQKRFIESVGSISELKREMDEMKKALMYARSPVVFCHNDLTAGNLIHIEDKDEVGLIDFEYAGPNYLAFEIANHFCEFAGVHDIDFSLYPTEDVQKRWITAYLEESTRGPVEVSEVHEIYREVNKFVLSNHLFWTVWGVFQAQNSSIDFDYIGYARVRYSEYKKNKDKFLAL